MATSKATQRVRKTAKSDEKCAKGHRERERGEEEKEEKGKRLKIHARPVFLLFFKGY